MPLNGTAIRADEDAMRGYYRRTVGFRLVLTGQVKDPATKDVFVTTLRRSHAEAAAAY